MASEAQPHATSVAASAAAPAIAPIAAPIAPPPSTSTPGHQAPSFAAGIPLNQKLFGVVKAVMNGDTVVIMKDAKNLAGPPPEIRLTLASLQAPSMYPEEQPFAFESREYLRKLVIGQTVQFVVEYKVESVQRLFGSVYLNVDGVPTSVSRQIVRNGYAKVRVPQGKNESGSHELEQLLELESQAKGEPLGIHVLGKKGRSIAAGISSDLLLDSWKGKTLKGIVEFVVTGSLFKVSVHDPAIDAWIQRDLQLAGLQCPGFKRDQESNKPVPMPYALNAKFCTESNLLHRDIEFVVLHGERQGGAGSGTNFNYPLYCQVTKVEGKPGFSIAETLLQTGLAKTLGWSLVECGADAMKLRMAEKAGRDAQRGVWIGFKAENSAASLGTQSGPFKVLEIVSGDTLVVIPEQGSTNPLRVSLASIRAPRIARGNAAEEFGGFEAREFLRQKLIGQNKKVKVDIRYQKSMNPQATATGGAAAAPISGAASPPGPPMIFADVSLERPDGTMENMALSLVNQGLANVTRHRSGEDTSAIYEELLAAEKAALDEKKGIHKSGQAAPRRMNDLTTKDSAKRAKDMLTFLERAGVIRGIVEYASTGSRFRLYVPKDHMLVAVALRGARAPSAARKRPGPSPNTWVVEDPGEPGGEDSLFFSKSQYMQRDVEFEVFGVDRNGTFLVDMYIRSGSQSRDIAEELLEAGFAKFTSHASGPKFASSKYENAEKKAKEAKRGIWMYSTNEEEKQEQASAAALEATEGSMGVPKLIFVSGVAMGGRIFYRELDAEGHDGIKKLEAAFKELSAANQVQANVAELRNGELIAVLLDKSWFRAKVVRKMPDRALVKLIDVGTETYIHSGMSYKIPAGSYLSKERPLSRELRMEGIVVAGANENEGADTYSDSQFADQATHWLQQRVVAQPVIVVPCAVQNGVLQVELYEKKEGDSDLKEQIKGTSVNREILHSGLARVVRLKGAVGKAALAKYEQDEQVARMAHLNLFEYGDPFASDEDEPSKANRM